MKPALIFHQYIWLVNTLLRRGRMTLEELNRAWVADGVADGNPLSRSTFNRQRDAVLDMFGIIIDCDTTGGYHYYIGNPDVLESDSIERWMLSTLTVGRVLSDGASIHDHIILEEVPAGEEYLTLIIQAIKSGKRIKMGYQRFDANERSFTISPYALKLFQRRWYMLGYTGRYIANFSLDRMTSMEITDESFEMPADFSPQAYYNEYFGVLTDGTPMEHVVIRAYGVTPAYLRTLPLHHSQREIATTDDYADFAFDIRPSDDFTGHLLSRGNSIEVLEPQSLRELMRLCIQDMLDNYE